MEGIKGYKYKLDGEFVGNSTYYPDNFCYNPQKMKDFYLPNGIHNVSSCKFDAPAYVSYPHFYMADPGKRFPISSFRFLKLITYIFS